MNRLQYLLLALSLPFATTTVNARSTYVVHTDSVIQTIDGFGASDAWSMRFVGEMDESMQNRVARMLFGTLSDSDGNPEGIGLSIWRFNIGAGSVEQGDSSGINSGTRTECFLTGNSTYDWNKQAGQRNFLKLAKKFGVPYLLGFLNSPPVYYTKNGLATNTGRDGTYNLKEDNYEDFVKFMAEVIQGLKTHHGITLQYISPVNEPDGHWNWQGPKQEGTPATKYEIAKLAGMLNEELQKQNIDAGIIIPESSDYRCMMATHHTGPERGYEIQSFFCPDSTDTYLGKLSHLPRIMAGHSYWTNTPVPYMKECRKALRDTLAKYNVDFWQSEVCIMGNDEEIGGGAGYDRSMKTALYVARIIHHDLVFANARSWQWWRAIGGDYKDGLLFQYTDTKTGNDTIVDSKLLWSLGNYSRFIRPGAVRLNVSEMGNPDADGATDPYGVMCSAYRNKDGHTVIVAINYGEVTANVGFSGLQPSEWHAYRTSDNNESLTHIGIIDDISDTHLPGRSITTFVAKKM